MIQRANFCELKFGDKLCCFSEDGGIGFYNYLSRVPDWEDTHCFLSTYGCTAKCFIKEEIDEDFYIYDSEEEVYAKAEEIRSEYYTTWLNNHKK